MTHKNVKRKVAAFSLITLSGVVLNVVLAYISNLIGAPFPVDSVGTFFAAAAGSPLSAVVAAFLSNLVEALTESEGIYFGIVGTVTAVLASWMYRKGFFSKIGKGAAAVLFIAAARAILRTAVSFFLSGYGLGGGSTAVFASRISSVGLGNFPSLLCANFVFDLCDVAVTLLCAMCIYMLIPSGIKSEFAEIKSENESLHFRAVARHSLLKKVIIGITAAEIVLGALACMIGYFLYHNVCIGKYTDICKGVSESAALLVDADHVGDYLLHGRNVRGYVDTEKDLYRLKQSFPQVEYIYAYRIERDGCHVVFDLDTEGLAASEIGSVVPFDESFTELLPSLFAGEKIDPIITNDTYGWLLTVYTPIYTSEGACACYMAADISMNDVTYDETAFIVKMTSLFFGLSIVIICLLLDLVKYGAVLPINAMADAADGFAYDTEEGRTAGLSKLAEIDIRSEDEIQNLYRSLSKMAQDSSRYIGEVKQKSEQIEKMQSEIIMTFAEMVEARDKCTGDHIKKTSAYVSAIARELLRAGRFPETVNEEYLERVIRSAPLHDVGKIKVPDAILNKPGRLTEEEFELMKRHTLEGETILKNASGIAGEKGYLKEAVEMAAYHHERWDGSGYPYGKKGEEIPLSARIMAVADVFDALVSRRSYKEPFSFEKAIGIIEEGSGTHFDPAVVEAFLSVAKDVYESVAK